MNRRMFLKSSGIAGAAVLTAPSVLTMEGCSADTLKSYLNLVLDSAKKILALSSSSDSWYATLTNAIAVFESTESTWNGSTAVNAVVSALDTVEAILAVIPLTAQYSALIDLLVTTIDLILTTYVKVSLVPMKVQSLAKANLHRGRVPLNEPRFLQSKSAAYKQQWNDIVAGNSNLAQAKL